MKIAIIGYGKLGKAIESAAIKKGHEVHIKINSQNIQSLTQENLKSVDVAFECSTPSSVFSNLKLIASAGVPCVAGTTAWLDKKEEIETCFRNANGAFLYASNFSIGMNITFYLNELIASLMKKHSQYIPSIEEIHHLQKLDSPSGTAITLSQPIINSDDRIDHWTLNQNDTSKLPILASREKGIAGIHKVTYKSSADMFSISHTAFNRSGFGEGAILAGEWLMNKQGVFTMKDVLNLR